MEQKPPSDGSTAPHAGIGPGWLFGQVYSLAGHALGPGMAVMCAVLWIGLNWHSLGWKPVVAIGGPPHLINWYCGWLLVWASVVAGVAYGLFASEEGEVTPHRQGVWLGLAALAAAGVINLLFGISSSPPAMTPAGSVAGLCFILTGLLLPTVCFLSLWRGWIKFLVILPIFTLSLGVFATVQGNSEEDYSKLFNVPASLE